MKETEFTVTVEQNKIMALKIKELKAENEELIKKLYTEILKTTQLSDKIVEFELENEELKDKLSDTERRLVELSKANTHNLVLLQRRNKCLDEIEECIKCCTTTLYGCGNCKNGDECNGALSDLILQLIKQAKKGEE